MTEQHFSDHEPPELRRDVLALSMRAMGVEVSERDWNGQTDEEIRRTVRRFAREEISELPEPPSNFQRLAAEKVLEICAPTHLKLVRTGEEKTRSTALDLNRQAFAIDLEGLEVFKGLDVQFDTSKWEGLLDFDVLIRVFSKIPKEVQLKQQLQLEITKLWNKHRSH